MSFNRLFGTVFIGLLALCAPHTAIAHEFWLQAKEWQVAPGDSILADIKIGENFKGANYSYFPNGFKRFELAVGDEVTPVTGRTGDRPAARIATTRAGLHILVHQTNDLSLTYSEWEKFTDFVAHKDFVGALENHAARDLPETGFKEAYSRFAKALVGVGEAAGQDRAFGLETEIVALANPYTDDMTAGFPVRLLYQGTPRAMAQVELYQMMPDGSMVSVSLHRTDAQGEVTLPVEPGKVYMAAAVVLRVPSEALAEATGAVWESLWANLTFALP